MCWRWRKRRDELRIEDFESSVRGTPLAGRLENVGPIHCRWTCITRGDCAACEAVLDAGLLHQNQVRLVEDSRGRSVNAKEATGPRGCPAAFDPIKKTAGVCLKGNLAPEGCVLNTYGHEKPYHRGPAQGVDARRSMDAAVNRGDPEGRCRSGGMKARGGPGMEK